MVNAGKGSRFHPGHGRQMKEWLVVNNEDSDWVGIANEACAYVKQESSRH